MSQEVNMLPDDNLSSSSGLPNFGPNGLRPLPPSADPAPSPSSLPNPTTWPLAVAGNTSSSSPWPHSNPTPGSSAAFNVNPAPVFPSRWPADASASAGPSPTPSAFQAAFQGSPGLHSRMSQLPISPPHFEEPSLPTLQQMRSRNSNNNNSPFVSSVAITESLSDLNLGGEAPPPGKIRRRNALTTEAADDIFSAAEVMQRLENLNSAAMQQGGEGGRPLHVELGDLSIRQRKKAIPRKSVSVGSVSTCRVPPSMMEEDGGVRQWSISLHEDLQKMMPKKLVPESLVEHYLKKERNALVLYRPPQNMVEELLQSRTTRKEEDVEDAEIDDEEDQGQMVEEVEMN